MDALPQTPPGARLLRQVWALACAAALTWALEHLVRRWTGAAPARLVTALTFTLALGLGHVSWWLGMLLLAALRPRPSSRPSRAG